MPETLRIAINGASLSVPQGTTVAAAVAMANAACRRSVSGEARGAFCGMGICMECRVTIDGRQHRRSCQIVCVAGMDVRSEGGA